MKVDVEISKNEIRTLRYLIRKLGDRRITFLFDMIKKEGGKLYD